MKKIFNKITISALASLTLVACEGMMDIHKEYVENGEIIYSPQPDSISFIAGKERIRFDCFLKNSPNVKTIDVFWNSKRDSMIIPVSPTSERDSFTFIIPNLIEQSYTFDVRTTDNFGHRSLWKSDFGNSYGAGYEKVIFNRRVKDVALSEYGGEVNWLAKADGLVRVEVKYTKTDGSEGLVKTDGEQSTSSLPDAKAGTNFQYRSAYIPEEASIDTFFLDWVTSESTFPTMFAYDRSLWTVLACSDERVDDGGGKNMIIDGKIDTYWHSQWGPDMPLPHWILIDLSKPINAIGFRFLSRSGTTDNKDIEIYMGNTPDADATDWVKVGELYDMSKTENDIPSLDASFKGRYIKLLFIGSNRGPFTNCAEFYVVGGA
ncbi:MAG: discoidin domain-containing protein [Tannerella sp.]|jgi:hypothetical protein|nr:discoidin domain-containing protein [Tannerella sp.]